MERTRVEMDLNGCFGSLKLPRRNLKFEVLINTERERERERSVWGSLLLRLHLHNKKQITISY
jgi:hypothetical protein